MRCAPAFRQAAAGPAARARAFVEAPSIAQATDLACRVGAPDAALRVALWGDSIGLAFLPAIDAAAADLGVGGPLLAWAGRPPFPKLMQHADNQAKSRDCIAFNDRVPRIAQDAGIDVMVLTGLLPGRLNADPGRADILVQATEALAANGIRTVILPPPPRVDFNLPEELARAAIFGVPPRHGQTRAEYDAWLALLRKAVAAMPKGTIYVDLAPIFCPAGQTHCRLTDDDGAPVLADHWRPRAAGAALAAPLLERALAGIPD